MNGTFHVVHFMSQSLCEPLLPSREVEVVHGSNVMATGLSLRNFSTLYVVYFDEQKGTSSIYIVNRSLVSGEIFTKEPDLPCTIVKSC